MMTFKPELRVTLGFMCLECSRTFYAVTGGAGYVSRLQEEIYIYKYRPIFLIYKYRQGSSSVIFIISCCCCGVVHRISNSGIVGCDVVSIVTTPCLSE